MSDAFLSSRWALIRRNELVDIPDNIAIHSDFLQKISYEAFESAFREIGGLFYQMYSDMADTPQKFGLPLYKIDEYDYFSSQAREARSAPWQLFYFLFCLFACGSFQDKVFVSDTVQVRKMNKAKRRIYCWKSCVITVLCLTTSKSFSCHQAKRWKSITQIIGMFWKFYMLSQIK